MGRIPVFVTPFPIAAVGFVLSLVVIAAHFQRENERFQMTITCVLRFNHHFMNFKLEHNKIMTIPSHVESSQAEANHELDFVRLNANDKFHVHTM